MSAALAVWLLAATVEPPDSRVALPRFSLRDLEGKSLQPKDLAGQVAVVTFWATWCAPCKQELAALAALRDKLGADAFRIVAIATDGPETAATVRSAVKQHGWTFRVAPDPDGAVTARLNPRGSVPYTIFVDKKGRVAKRHAGYQSGDEAGYAELLATLSSE